MIYFHIPFCKQACHYCDFHFSTSLRYKEDMLQTMSMELEQRSQYLTDKTVQSIYFGGGTPSLLEEKEINMLLDKISTLYHIAADAEITLEANPDDLDATKVAAFRRTPINRFSIGIQSFFEEDLRWMNRAHNAQEAHSSIKRVQDAGFDNITCDLIYGYPLLTAEKWNSNIQTVLDLHIPHISSYALTVEKKTALDHFIRQGKTAAMDEEQSAAHMTTLIHMLTTQGFEHYEISNFARPGKYAKHNTNYWKGKHYIGIGPSAHSFDGVSRSWNVANNSKYIQAIHEDAEFQETEYLSIQDRINEYIMTSLRTMWGIDIYYFKQTFGLAAFNRLLQQAQPFAARNQLTDTPTHIQLTPSGKLLADHIISDLFEV